MTAQVSSPTAPEDPLWSFVTAARSAFVASDSIAENGWSDDKRDLVQGVSIKRCTTDTISEEGPITVAIVTQPVGVVIPPHRHHESHVLLKVTKGAIQVDCEGYSRRIGKDQECLIPKGFSHSVFALACEEAEAATYLSAHLKEFLTLDDNRFLTDWRDYAHTSESEIVCERLSWFLSLQETYLVQPETYRAWFYVVHIDPDTDKPDLDEKGFAGFWQDHEEEANAVRYRDKDVSAFRLGIVLSEDAWSRAGQYAPVFVAHEQEATAKALSAFRAFYCTSESKWKLSHENSLLSDHLEKHEDNFQAYMNLLQNVFLKDTQYIVYMTPPQQPGLSDFLERVKRQPFSSCIVGMTHGSKRFIDALFNYFLLCSSVLQQMRFAVRADITDIRYEERRRRDFFVKEFIPKLQGPKVD